MDLVLGKRFRDESDHDSSQNIIFPERISFQDKGFVTDRVVGKRFCDGSRFGEQVSRRISRWGTGFVTDLMLGEEVL